MAADEPRIHQVHTTVITTDDPLGEPPDGMPLGLAYLNIGRPDVGEIPVGASNSDYFDGALLAVGFQYGATFSIEGSAVMIGMGIALTAAHIFDDHWEAIETGEAVVIAGGVRTGGALDAWHCYSIMKDSGDLAVMSLKLASALPPENVFSTLPLTTRIPVVGEPITIAGFRFEEPSVSELVGDPVQIDGLLYVSHGVAGEFSFPRHSSLRPFATIDVLAGSLGGMSGGAVLDSSGAVLGVLSRGFNDIDTGPASFAAWWPPVLNFRPQLTWPRGFYADDPVVIAEIPGLAMYGREYIYYDDATGGYELRRWATLPTIEAADE
jgi:hypothetical protein